jgi:selenoprotein W-related protein
MGVGKPQLIESSGGVFEVKLGQNLLFSKRKENRFPDHAEIINLIKQTSD